MTKAVRVSTYNLPNANIFSSPNPATAMVPTVCKNITQDLNNAGYVRTKAKRNVESLLFSQCV